jgi:anti-sigma B factor antagonist
LTEPPTEFEVTTEQRNGARVVRVSGEVDISTHERLGEHLVSEADAGEFVVVDLSSCSVIDSSGIRALLLGHKATKTAGPGRFAIVATSPQVARVLELTGVDDAISLYDSVEDALANQKG